MRILRSFRIDVYKRQDMLDQNNFEQYHRVYAWTAVVLAIQILYKFVDLLVINGCVDLPQQVILRHHVCQTYKFQLSSVFCVLYQHFYHPTPLYRIPFPYTRKRPLIGGLFRQAEHQSKDWCFFRFTAVWKRRQRTSISYRKNSAFRKSGSG